MSAGNAGAGRVAAGAAATLPLSGSEDAYVDGAFGAPRGRGNNNCYAWAIDHYRNAGGDKLQPGNISRRERGGLDLGSCSALRARALADLRGRAYAAAPDAPCRAGFYKVMAFLDPNNDYHWYKQHRDALVRVSGEAGSLRALASRLGVRRDQIRSPARAPRPGDTVLVRDAGLWSHKRGFATAPILKDACGRVIKDPRAACRDYGDINYDTFCGAFCVRSSSRGSRKGRRA